MSVGATHASPRGGAWPTSPPVPSAPPGAAPTHNRRCRGDSRIARGGLLNPTQAAPIPRLHIFSTLSPQLLSQSFTTPNYDLINSKSQPDTWLME